jgi:hypothetical protein
LRYVFHCISNMQYFVCFYFPSGFNLSSDRAGYQFLMILVDEVYILLTD